LEEKLLPGLIGGSSSRERGGAMAAPDVSGFPV